MSEKNEKTISERGVEFFGSDKFMWLLLGPGFAFVAGLAIYGALSDMKGAIEAIKAIIW